MILGTCEVPVQAATEGHFYDPQVISMTHGYVLAGIGVNVPGSYYYKKTWGCL